MKIEPGKTYKLKQLVQNPKPDGRERYDWRKERVWNEGRIFFARKYVVHPLDNDAAERAFVQLWSGQYTTNCISEHTDEAQWTVLVQNLKEHTPTISELLKMRGRSGGNVLTLLERSGVVTRTQIKTALDRMDDFTVEEWEEL